EDAKQEGAEIGAALTRISPTAYDEFLLLLNLQLAPIGCAFAGHVSRRGALGNQPFPALRGRSFVQSASIACHLVADAQDRRSGFFEEPFEDLATVGQRSVAQIVSSFSQHVESYQSHGGAGRPAFAAKPLRRGRAGTDRLVGAS